MYWRARHAAESGGAVPCEPPPLVRSQSAPSSVPLPPPPVPHADLVGLRVRFSGFYFAPPGCAAPMPDFMGSVRSVRRASPCVLVCFDDADVWWLDVADVRDFHLGDAAAVQARIDAGRHVAGQRVAAPDAGPSTPTRTAPGGRAAGGELRPQQQQQQRRRQQQQQQRQQQQRRRRLRVVTVAAADKSREKNPLVLKRCDSKSV